MTDLLSRLRRFFRELKRRNVYKVAVTYIAVAFVGLQAVNLLIPATTLPGWADQLFLGLVILGFPVSVVVAWAFEMTADGMRRTPEAEGEPAVGSAYQWIGLALIVVLAVGVWYATAGDGGESATDTAASGQDTAQAEQRFSSPSASGDRPFVAVLPLENLSPSDENAFFAAGVHEEILNQLSKVSGLGVFARTTMSQYADTEKSVYEIGSELNAQAVLEGSVRRAGGRVRISAQLIDPQSRDHLWSKTYERRLTTDAIFDIQSQIAQRVASALQAELAPGEQRNIRRAPTPDLSAYDAYVKGREYIWEGLSGGANVFKHDTAVVNLRQAIERDSTFAAAHGLLGFIYGFRFDFTRAPRWADSARTYIARANSLQPGLVQTHLARGVISSSTGDYDRSLKELRAVLNEQPDHGFAMMTMSEVYGALGEQAQALRWALRAARHDPRNVAYIFDVMGLLRRLQFYDAAMAWYKRGISHHPQNSLLYLERSQMEADQGRYEEAYKISQQALQWHPEVIRLQRDAGVAKLQLGQLTQAREHLERVRDLIERRHQRSPGFPELPSFALGYTYLKLGEEERGRRLLEDAVRWIQANLNTQPSGGAWAYSAALQSALGESSAAREDLQRAAEAGWTEVARFSYPLFDPVRNQPWFEQVKRQVESNLKAQREQVCQLGIDLYPPGAEPDSVG